MKKETYTSRTNFTKSRNKLEYKVTCDVKKKNRKEMLQWNKKKKRKERKKITSMRKEKITTEGKEKIEESKATNGRDR